MDNTIARRLTINISIQGQIQMGATEVPAARIRELLIQHQSEHEGAAAVRIRTDKAVPYGMVEPLLRDIAEAGIVDITFAVREGK